MRTLDDFAHRKLEELEHACLRRTLADSFRRDSLWIERDGRRFLSFSCNDYLNLSHHPAVKAAAIAAVERYGAGAGASRLVTGNHPLLAELEAKLARAETLVFRHNDVSHAEALLSQHRARGRHALLVTEGVFSMDGDRAPLKDLAVLCQAFDTWLMTDDAHGLGVIGNGRGSAAAAGGAASVPLQMGTLSKAIGAYGGYLCASRPVVDLMPNRARTLIYSTALPPAMAAAAIAALTIIENDPGLTARPLAKARAFTARLGLPEAQSPVVPLILGPPEAALAASRKLAGKGFLVTAIRPPTVPADTARLRFAFTAMHPGEEIARLAEAVTSLGEFKAARTQGLQESRA